MTDSISAKTLRSLLRGLRDGLTSAELQAATGRSRSALYRDLAALRELGVGVVPRSKRSGGDPPYQVVDWGVFDPKRF